MKKISFLVVAFMFVLIGCNNTESTSEQTDSAVTQNDDNEISDEFYGVWEYVEGEYIVEATMGDYVLESSRECDRYLNFSTDGDNLVYTVLNNDYETEDDLLEAFENMTSRVKNVDYIDEQQVELSLASNKIVYELNNNELTGYLLNDQDEKVDGSYCQYEKSIDL